MKTAKRSDRIKAMSWYKKLSQFRWFNKFTEKIQLDGNNQYLSHAYQYDVDGEELPEPSKGKLNMKALLFSLAIALFLFLALNYILVALKTLSSNTIYEVNWNQTFAFKNALRFSLSRYTYLILFAADGLFAFLLYSKTSYKDESNFVYGQKGDSRLATIEEIQGQYKEVPEKGERYRGPGGFPVSHYRNKYYVETGTYNTCILGTTRSGKGESALIPFIDIVSRSIDCQPSMVISDPKIEHCVAEKEILEERGYHVEVLNFLEPSQSMSYNPLEGVKRAWQLGNPYEAAKKANTITYTMYNDPNAGQNKFFYDAAQNAVTAIILAITEYCAKKDCMQKVSMSNVMDMLFELGMLNYKNHPDDLIENKNALDEYFNTLPQGSVAKRYYGSTSFAGDGKARGSILSTAIKGLKPFMNPEFAKMTSMNSFPLKSVGFPKWIEGQMENSYTGERLIVSFHKSKGKELIGEKHTVKVKALGVYTLNFKEDISEGDYVLIKHEDGEKCYKLIFQISFKTSPELTLAKLVNTFPEHSMRLKPSIYYRDKPIALFMLIPDQDASNHTLASIFIKQLYMENAENCTLTKGNKCHRRIEFILDEFGQLPPIEGMGEMATVCGGRNMVFTLAVQSYFQLEEKYGKNIARVIKENCQNHDYIASRDTETIEEFSKSIGNKTVISRSNSEEYMDLNPHAQKSADSIRILTPERLSQLLEGESVIVRQLHRRDNEGYKIRPFPIFNTGVTSMPYRFEFLSPWMDTSNDINDIDINSAHASLNLEDLYIDFSDFIKHPEARRKYEEQKKNDDMMKKMLNETQLQNAEDMTIVRNRLAQRRMQKQKEDS